MADEAAQAVVGARGFGGELAARRVREVVGLGDGHCFAFWGGGRVGGERLAGWYGGCHFERCSGLGFCLVLCGGGIEVVDESIGRRFFFGRK